VFTALEVCYENALYKLKHIFDNDDDTDVTLKESSDGETLIAVCRCMVPNLCSSRGESTTSKVRFYPQVRPPPQKN